MRIWNIAYVSYVYMYLVHTPESEKKQTSVYLIKRKIRKKMLVYTRFVSKPYFTQTIYKFPDRLVGGSDSAFVSTAAAELKFNRNPAIHPPSHREAVQERTYGSRR